MRISQHIQQRPQALTLKTYQHPPTLIFLQGRQQHVPYWYSAFWTAIGGLVFLQEI